MTANSLAVVPSLEELEHCEAELLVQVASADRDYAGLRNLDHVLGLVECRMQIALLILQLLAAAEKPATRLRAREAAGAAIVMLDELVASGVSDDQRSTISDHPSYAGAKQSLERLILAGGGSLLEAETRPVFKARLVSGVVAAALRAHAAPDDRYYQLIRPESLPRWLRTPVRLLFAVIAPEHQADLPYGIEDGAEEQLSAERIHLALRQAILFLREEVLVPLAVRYRSGRNLDRVRDTVKQQVTRRLAAVESRRSSTKMTVTCAVCRVARGGAAVYRR